MEQEEVNIMNRLSDQFKDGFVIKKTVLKARDIYNKYSGERVDYCMCTEVRRRIYAKTFIEWYESQNR